MRRHAVWAYYKDPNLEESLRKVSPRNFTGSGYCIPKHEYDISFAFGSKKKAAEVAAKLRRRKGVSRVERSLLDDL